MMMRHRRPKGRLLLTALALSTALLLGCAKERVADKAGSPGAATENSELLTIEARDFPDIKPVSANLTNRDVGSARARIGGTLVELSVREGDIVEEGQVIAVIADDRRNLEANAASSTAAAAEARAIEARAALKRVEELFAEGVYAQARLDSARAEARTADAQLKAARSGSAALTEVASQGRVLAPAAGKVTNAPIPQGGVVMPGEIVAEIATGRRVLRAELPEADGGDLREGDEISIVAANGDGATLAKIVQVYPAVRDGKIVIDIDAAAFDGGFVGMRVPVLIPIGMRPTIAIPEKFISVRYGVDYVTLQRKDGGALDAPVQRGRVFISDGESLIESLTGLRAGDVIIAPADTQDDRQIAASEERP
jgi:RND family efflux transporter MFP subunit